MSSWQEINEITEAWKQAIEELNTCEDLVEQDKLKAQIAQLKEKIENRNSSSTK